MRTHRPLRLETLESRTTPSDVTVVTPPVVSVAIICPTYPPTTPTIDPNAPTVTTGGGIYVGGVNTPLLPPITVGAPTTPPVTGLGAITPPPIGTPIGL